MESRLLRLHERSARIARNGWLGHPPETVDTFVIGAGLAGLSAAVRRHEAGRDVLVLASQGMESILKTVA